MLGQGDNALCPSSFWFPSSLSTLSTLPSSVFFPFIYFRLQSPSIVGCRKCVCMAERNGDQGCGCHCPGAEVWGWTLTQLDLNVKAGATPSTCKYTQDFPPLSMPFLILLFYNLAGKVGQEIMFIHKSHLWVCVGIFMCLSTRPVYDRLFRT